MLQYEEKVNYSHEAGGLSDPRAVSQGGGEEHEDLYSKMLES